MNFPLVQYNNIEFMQFILQNLYMLLNPGAKILLLHTII